MRKMVVTKMSIRQACWILEGQAAQPSLVNRHRLIGLAWRDREDTSLPGRRIDVQPAACQVVAMPVKAGVAQLIAQLPLFATQVVERQTHMALALVGGVVDSNDDPLGTDAMPGIGDETVVGPVAVPGGNAIEQLP